MSAIRWVACDPRTGNILEELPGLQLNSSMTSIIGKGESINVRLPVSDRMPERWRLATEPNRALLVAHYDDDDQTILWAGPVTSRQYGSAPYINLGVMNVEKWLAGNFLPDQTYEQVDQAHIMAGIGLDFAAEHFNGTPAITETGILRDRHYYSIDDKDRLAAMQNLMRVIGGPEFTIGWRWENGRAVCVPTVAQQLGSDEDPGILLSRADWTFMQDYTYGKGATILVGSGERQADERTQVRREATWLLEAGYLPFEYRWQPDTGSDKAEIIAEYVDQRIADMYDGTESISITIEIDQMIINKDIRLGDGLLIDLRNDDLPGVNLQMKTRMVGWTAESEGGDGQITHITPILFGDEQAEVEAEEFLPEDDGEEEEV